MASNIVEVAGTLRDDGTLVLDARPNLPPGRVRVTVRPVPDYKETEIWKFFEQVRAEQQARGFAPRSREEIDADLAAARPEDEGRMREIERIHEECERRQREPRGAGPP
ncbi:MAG TPA: hypothetical protein VKA46_33700 [Gemmataceae bacterium]|nr:hypothetical protein [Gemmataceae bacterium]